MLIRAFTAARSGYLKFCQAKESLAAQFAVAACPQDARMSLTYCGIQVDDFIALTNKMVAQRDPELIFLAELMRNENDDELEFSSFSDLMGHLAQGVAIMDDPADDIDGNALDMTYGQAYPNCRYLCRTAKIFVADFQRLPVPVGYLVDASLTLKKNLIVRCIEAAEDEFYLTPVERRPRLPASAPEL